MKLGKWFLLSIVTILMCGTYNVYANDVIGVDFIPKKIEQGEPVVIDIELKEQLKEDEFLSLSFINKFSNELLYNFITLDKDGKNNIGIISNQNLTQGQYEIIRVDVVDENDNITDKLSFSSISSIDRYFQVLEGTYEEIGYVENLYVKNKSIEIGEKIDIEVKIKNNYNADEYELGAVFKHVTRDEKFEVPLEYSSGNLFKTHDDYEIPDTVDTGIYNFYELNQYKVFEYNDKNIKSLLHIYEEKDFGFIQIKVKESTAEEKYNEQLNKQAIYVNDYRKYYYSTINSNNNEFEIKTSFDDDVATVHIPYSIIKNVYLNNQDFEFNITVEDFSYTLPVEVLYNNANIEKILKRKRNEGIELEDVSIKIIITDYSKNEDYVKAFINNFDKSILISGIYDVNLQLSHEENILDDLNLLSEYITKSISFTIRNSDLIGVYMLDKGMNLNFVPHKIQSNGNKKIAIINNINNGTFGVMSRHINYEDVETGAWYEEAVLLSSGKGLTSGINNHFMPQGLVTRAEFVTMIVNGIDLPSVSTTNTEKYEDVKSNNWYYNDVMLAKEYGLLDEISTSYFEPSKFITREEIANIVGKVLEIKTVAITQNYIDLNQMFVDGHDINKNYVNEIENVYKTSLMKGNTNGEFNPKLNCTRAEAVQLQVNLLKLLGYL